MEFFSQVTINSVVAGSIYALVALGFNLIFDTTKFFNLAHGVYVAIGGYATFYFTKILSLPIFWGVILGILVAGLVGYGSDKLIFLPLRKRKASNMVLLVASLGLFTLLQAVLAMTFSSQFRTLAVHGGEQTKFNIGGGVITATQLMLLLVTLLVAVGLFLVLKKTMFGKAVRAISDDEEVSKIIGINTNKIIGYVFFLGAIIAGIAGVLIGFDTGIEPTMGLRLLLKGVIAAIIGGVGSVPGGFAGAYLLGFVENFGIVHIASEWKDAIAFVLLIVFLLFKPTGLFKK